jgi:hypothetical protein
VPEEEPEPRQLSLGEIVWQGLLHEAEPFEDLIGYVGLVSPWGKPGWEDVPTGDYL